MPAETHPVLPVPQLVVRAMQIWYEVAPVAAVQLNPRLLVGRPVAPFAGADLTNEAGLVAAAPTTIDSERVAVATPSDTATVNPDVAAAVGVPDSTPDAASVSPAGSVPDATDHEYEPVPPEIGRAHV